MSAEASDDAVFTYEIKVNTAIADELRVLETFSELSASVLFSRALQMYADLERFRRRGERVFYGDPKISEHLNEYRWE